MNFVANFVAQVVIEDTEEFLRQEKAGINSDPYYFFNQRLISLEELYIEDSLYRPYFEAFLIKSDSSLKEYIIKSCIKFAGSLAIRPRYSQGYDLGFLR